MLLNFFWTYDDTELAKHTSVFIFARISNKHIFSYFVIYVWVGINHANCFAKLTRSLAQLQSKISDWVASLCPLPSWPKLCEQWCVLLFWTRKRQFTVKLTLHSYSLLQEQFEIFNMKCNIKEQFREQDSVW